MDIKDLRCFCVTAELEHVTRAAASLNIAQPYLSRIIHSIEDEVGAKLFEQTGRNIHLTYSGEVFYKNAKKVLSSMDALYSEMDYLYSNRENSVTLLVNSDTFITRLVQEFHKLNPPYALSIQQATLEGMEEALVNGSAQFALSSPPMLGYNTSNNIETQTVLGLKGYIVVPDNHPFSGRDKVSIDDLRNERIVTMPKDNAMRVRLQPIFDEYSYLPQIVLETNNLNIISNAVKGGFGIAFVTELMAKDYGFAKENILNIDIPDVMGYYGLSYNRLSHDRRNIQHFMQFLQSFFSNLRSELDRDSPLEKI